VLYHVPGTHQEGSQGDRKPFITYPPILSFVMFDFSVSCRGKDLRGHCEQEPCFALEVLRFMGFLGTHFLNKSI
jgi:hypothetical protein